MGIFSRDKVSPSREKSRKKRAEVCRTFFSKEYESIQIKIGEDLNSNNLEISEIAKRKERAWKIITNHTLNLMTQWDKNYIRGYEVLSKWEYFADVVHYSKYNFASENSQKITAEEILENIRYLNQITKNGGLATMPGSNLENSRKYRAYLSANSFSGTLGWDWTNATMGEKNFIDNQLALLVGDFMTEIFDRYGLNNESGFSGIFSAALLNSWNSSTLRSELD